MLFEEIQATIERMKHDGKRLFVGSSFQTHSIPLLHIISRIDQSIPVAFINTGFHFPETMSFKDEVLESLGLTAINVQSMIPRNQQRDSNGQFYFTSDPDRCCFINKTQALEPVLQSHDIWINGIRADQNANRRNMKVFQDAPFGVQRFHPVLDWTGKMIYEYIEEYSLPRHPLEDQGYLSIGCEPCTRKLDLSNDRGGRWFGLNKSECGLHTDLVK